MGKIREGSTYYLIVVLLAALSSLVTASAFAYDVAHGQTNLLAITIPSCGESNSTGEAGCNNSTQGLGITFEGTTTVAELLAVIGLILVIVAWAKWRGGVLALPEAALEYGLTYEEEARRAVSGYKRTLYTFLAEFFVGLVVSVVISAYVASLVASRPTGSTSVPVLSPGVFAGLTALAIISGVFEFLMYFFASGSLLDSLQGVSSEEVRRTLLEGRKYMLMGGGLLLPGSLTSVFTPFSFVLVAANALVFYGLYRIRAGYDAWLSNPPRTTTPPPSLFYPTSTLD